MSAFNVNYIQFSILSPEEMRGRSVCDVTDPKTDGGKLNSINDPRMGPMDANTRCQTCNKYYKDCVGHFGHIELVMPIFHPHPRFQATILKILRSMCHNPECNRCLVTIESARLLDIWFCNRSFRLDKLEKHCMKKPFCEHCQTVVHKIVFETIRTGTQYVIKNEDTDIKAILTPQNIYDMFSNLTEKDLKIMGFNSDLGTNPRFLNKSTFPCGDMKHRHQFRPEWLIMSVIPVLPPCTRPPSVISGITFPDDITDLYSHIVKCNNKLRGDKEASVPIKSKGRRKNCQLKPIEKINTYNSLVSYMYSLVSVQHPRGKTSNRTFRGKEYLGIENRLGKKGGMLRKNTIAKRTNHTGRSVIGGDPSLRMNELGVPKCMADKLIKPVVVRSFNYEYCERLLAEGKVKSVFYNDKRISLITPTGKHIPFELSPDMIDKRVILERKLQDGDVVIFNRQPTEPLC